MQIWQQGGTAYMAPTSGQISNSYITSGHRVSLWVRCVTGNVFSTKGIPIWKNPKKCLFSPCASISWISFRLWFWCNISRNLQPWDIVVLVWYITKYANLRHCGPGLIFHDICNHELLWFWCNISRNLELWDIVRDLIILMIYLIKSETMRYLI